MHWKTLLAKAVLYYVNIESESEVNVRNGFPEKVSIDPCISMLLAELN
jgi:hypothetical protein